MAHRFFVITGRLGTAAGACAAAIAVARAADAASRRHESSSRPQWLWTIDNVQLFRDSDGHVRFVDEASGRDLPERPSIVPPEAYAHRWRSEPPGCGAPPDLGKRARTSRHVLLIRHGQYAQEERDDGARVLTSMGKQQAELCARRLRGLHDAPSGAYSSCSLGALTSSTLTRAMQTADLIAPLLPHAVRDALSILNEGQPCLPEPSGARADRYKNRHRDAERIEAAYRLLCTPPSVGPERETFEVVVCHANVIRYVVCRALQLPPESWLRFSLPHASITHLVIRSNGDVSLKALGDSGFLPPELVSF